MMNSAGHRGSICEEKMLCISLRSGSASDPASGFVAFSTGKTWSKVSDAWYSEASEAK
jgi:hypothetical protein